LKYSYHCCKCNTDEHVKSAYKGAGWGGGGVGWEP